MFHNVVAHQIGPTRSNNGDIITLAQPFKKGCHPPERNGRKFALSAAIQKPYAENGILLQKGFPVDEPIPRK